MCLAIPVQIIAIEGDQAEVELEGVRRRVGLALVPEARVGDYVLVHTGFAINVLDADEAQATLALLAEMEEHRRNAESGECA
jgi:hydrogenase expression/formation protein HypC